jgi:addiction module HigA family antidote
MPTKLREIHPGEILQEEFLRPLEITKSRLAADIDLPIERVDEIVNGRAPIDIETAVRLGVYFKTDARFWVNLQSEYDIRTAEEELLPQMRKKIQAYSDKES